MLFKEPLPFIKKYVSDLDKALKKLCPKKGLSRSQQYWLSFCVMAIMVSNTVCWARFQKVGIGQYRIGALSWMFRKSNIPWELLLVSSVGLILKKYGVTEGNATIDETDKKRSKCTKRIAHVHKIKDKPSGGYIMGQNLVFLALITAKVTIPVGFWFHVPDPSLKEWHKNDKSLKKKGTPKASRPPKPDRDHKYPTIPQIAIKLLEQFKKNYPDIRIRCIFADALYGTGEFVDHAAALFEGVQVISQIRSNQLIRFRTQKRSVESYFATFPGTRQLIRIRGGKEVFVTVGSARLYVHAHEKKRFVIALKYEGEESYRYIIASDMTWRTLDIIQAYTLRWLIEVFFQDWKGNEGWGKLTKHPGDEGSSRSLILSLMVDHCLLFHPDQLAQIENKLPAYTVGSMIAKIKVEGLLSAIEETLLTGDPVEQFKKFATILREEVVQLNPSKKHMSAVDLGNMEASPALKYRQAA